MTFSTAIACLICMLFGGIIGMTVDSIVLGRVFQKELTEAVEEEKRESMRIVHDNYIKTELNTKLLLEELGEALSVDVVELPSFGYTVLKGAMGVAEGFAEPHMRDLNE